MATEIELLGGIDEDDEEGGEQELIPYVWPVCLSFIMNYGRLFSH